MVHSIYSSINTMDVYGDHQCPFIINYCCYIHFSPSSSSWKKILQKMKKKENYQMCSNLFIIANTSSYSSSSSWNQINEIFDFIHFIKLHSLIHSLLFTVYYININLNWPFPIRFHNNDSMYQSPISTLNIHSQVFEFFFRVNMKNFSIISMKTKQKKKEIHFIYSHSIT